MIGWVDLRAPNVLELVQDLREAPGGELLVGIRHQVEDEADPAWLLRADVLRGLAAIGEAGLAYDLLVKPHQLPAAVAAVRQLPDVRCVLDHAGKPAIARHEWQPWARWVAALAALPNVVCKLSGLVTEAQPDRWSVDEIRPYAEFVIDAFGVDRVMFGSDWPVCELAASYREVLKLVHALAQGLSLAERRALLGGVAAATYSLEPPDACDDRPPRRTGP